MAVRALLLLPLMLQRMFKDSCAAADWCSMMSLLADKTMQLLLHSASKDAIPPLQQGLLMRSDSVLATMRPLQPGSKLAALAACLPCLLAALANSTAALCKFCQGPGTRTAEL